MSEYSYLLSEAISSIIDTKDESALDSLLNGGGASSLFTDSVKGLDDFELISFIVIR